MKNLFYKIAFVLLLSGLFLVGCKNINHFDDYNITNIDAEFGIPLFSTSLTMKNILSSLEDQSAIRVGSDGLITLKYSGDVVGRSSDDIFNVLEVINGTQVPVLDTFVSIPMEISNDVELDYAKLIGGTAEWGFVSTHQEDVTVTIKFPKLLKDGVPFESTLFGAFDSNSGAAAEQLAGIDLSGYDLDAVDNSVEIEYKAYREDSGFNDKVTLVYVVFNDVRASYIEGFLGYEPYDFDRDTIDIDFFDNWTRGEVHFVDPKINVTVINSFGFPVRSDTKVLDIFTFNDDVIPLESEFIEQGIDFAYPGLDEVGESKSTHFSFNKDNSNIVEVIDAGPVAVDYRLDAIPNPDSDVAIRGFMTDTSNFVAVVDIELPLYGATFGFGVFDTLSVDTFDFDLDLGTYGEANYAEFKMLAVNGMPLDINLQLHFADANGQILGSLFTGEEKVIAAALVDGEGNVTESTRKETFATMEKENFQKLSETKFLYLVTSFSTNNDGVTDVKILADQGVDVGMGLKLGVTK